MNKCAACVPPSCEAVLRCISTKYDLRDVRLTCIMPLEKTNPRPSLRKIEMILMKTEKKFQAITIRVGASASLRAMLFLQQAPRGEMTLLTDRQGIRRR
jgi:hypothetical protein